MGATGDRRSSGNPGTPNYYATESMTEAQRIELAEAGRVEGLDDEIAMLRVKLRALANAEPPDHKLILRGTDALMRAVVAQYRLSPRAGKHLSDHLAALLKDLGDQMLPADR